MQIRRSSYADQIDVVAIDALSPICRKMPDTKFAGSFLGVFSPAARNRYDTRTLACQKSGDLYPPCKPRPDDRNPYLVFHICDFTLCMRKPEFKASFQI